MKPSRTEVLDHIAAHFGIPRAEVLAMFKTPTHPADMRDTFAACAIPGLVRVPHYSRSDVAGVAYQIADAMLQERAK